MLEICHLIDCPNWNEYVLLLSLLKLHIIITDDMLKRDKDFDILASFFVCSMQFSNSKVILSCHLLNWSGKN